MHDKQRLPAAQGPPVKSKRPVKKPVASNVDLREQLVNEGLVGPIHEVSIPAEMITRLNGIMLDIDPSLWSRGAALGLRKEPAAFFENVVEPMLSRHSILSSAEARNSGTGLHIIVWLKPGVEFANDGDRDRWAGAVKAVQHALPTDPNCPGITALTRPVGSVNGKNNAKVNRLKSGMPVTPEAVLAFCEQLRVKPFKTIGTILFGDGPVTPCPLCTEAGSRLGLLDHHGMCYGHCGRISLGLAFSHFFKAIKVGGPES